MKKKSSDIQAKKLFLYKKQLIAIGIDWDGRRQILGEDLVSREIATLWKTFLLALKERGLEEIGMMASDDHAGLRMAIAKIIPEAIWQRCYVHLLRKAVKHLPRKGDDNCLRELRWLMLERLNEETRRRIRAVRVFPNEQSWLRLLTESLR